MDDVYIQHGGEESREAYADWNGDTVIFPCFPAKSPTWQVSGWVLSQGGASPRTYGSRCAVVPVQLPSDGTGSLWMWYTVERENIFVS